MCQMEPLFEALGITYDYNAYKKELKATFEEERELSTTVGSNIVTVDLVNVANRAVLCRGQHGYGSA